MTITTKKVGLVLGLLIFALLNGMPNLSGLSPDGQFVLALLGLMAIWWVTEALPVPATSLVPLVMLPMGGTLSFRAAAAPYADPVIFLLLGGFIAAMAMQRWGLHERIALRILRIAGDHPTGLIGGFMAASAVLSMWISNTATTLMMVPIALSVSATLLSGSDTKKTGQFTVALLIACAWSASIGGLGTIIGTPPNAFVVSFIEKETGLVIDFLTWMKIGVPVVCLMVPLAWLVLTKLAFKFDSTGLKGGQAIVADRLAALGPLSTPEIRVALVFGAMATFWIFLSPLKTLPLFAGLSNAVVAIAGALLMFMIPSGDGGAQSPDETLLDWETAVTIPWGVLLLFGGGLSLAAAIKSTGLALWLGSMMGGLAGLPLIIIIGAIVLLVIFLTELTSNTATTAALVPILAALAAAGGLDPIYLAAPTAMAASSAFMLPVATAPNAVIFATGQVSIPAMARAGLIMNIFGAALLTTIMTIILPIIFA